MAFRTLEISHPCEIHIHHGQLAVEKANQQLMIPLEDLSTIVCIGSGIRLSTMAMARLCDYKIGLLIMPDNP